jgi:hypothetical protein
VKKAKACPKGTKRVRGKCKKAKVVKKKRIRFVRPPFTG